MRTFRLLFATMALPLLASLMSTEVYAVQWSWTGSMSVASQNYIVGGETAEAAGLQHSDFELEHAHLNINAEISDRFSAVLSPCLEHEGTLSIRAAYLDATLWEKDMETILAAEIGRFYVPFGKFNSLAEIGNYSTISRPMMFASHDQDIIILDGSPKPIFMSQYSEIGINLNGNKWLQDKHQLWYALWIGNGMTQEGAAGHVHGATSAHTGHPEHSELAAADISWLQKQRFASDNNMDKSFGARFAYGFMQYFNTGVSYYRGTYDPASLLSYSALGIDGELHYDKGDHQIQITGEWANAPTEFAANEAMAGMPEMVEVTKKEYTTSGYYGQITYGYQKKWEWVGVYDYLKRVGPEAKFDTTGTLQFENSEIDITSSTTKISGGVNYTPVEGVKFKSEYAIYSFSTNKKFDDAHRFSVAMVLTY